MHIRIFGDAPDPKEWGTNTSTESVWTNTVVQSLCQLAGRRTSGAAPWTFEMCDPLTWGSRTTAADLHIYLTEPCRLAVPWATCNMVLVSRAWWQTDATETSRAAAPLACERVLTLPAELGGGVYDPSRSARGTESESASVPGFGKAWLPWAAKEIDLFVLVGDGSSVVGLPADRLFTLRASAGATPLRMYADSWRRLMEQVERRRHPPALPAALPKGADIPRVGIITLTRNRSHWWPVMVRNVAGARWPLNRMEWIIVDDSDEGKDLAAQVALLREQAVGLTVNYVRLTPPAKERTAMTIGAKRNAAVAAASEGTGLFVCMDDDDYYHEDSIGRRVSWLTVPGGGAGRGAAYCATIPMYDTTRYISAVNVPPMILGAAQRVSEATLAFTRAFWAARPFPDVSMAEGEGFIVGREMETAEIPPYGVIVSFIHKKNTSSRRVPADQPANGCHYGFSDEFFSLVTETGMM